MRVGVEVGKTWSIFGGDARRLVRLPEGARGKLDTLIIRSIVRGWAEAMALAAMKDTRVGWHR